MATAEQVGKTTFTTPSDRELVAVREFEAPRAVVFEAHTSTAHVPHWMLGPGEWTMPVCEMALRPGGAWRFVWRQSDGNEMEMRGEFREIEAPARIVQTERWGDEWPETLNTTVFAEDDGRTRLTCTVLYPTQEARDAAMKTGMLEGWSQSYDRLEAYLPTMR